MSRRKQLKPQALRKDEEDVALNIEQTTVDQENDLKDTSDLSSIVSDLSDIGESELIEQCDSQESCHFVCSFCPSTFDAASLLKIHEQQHADLMPYRCSLCGKGFKHKRSQDRHQKLHSGIRKYKCNLCQTAFFRSDHLKLHIKTHETAKYPFACVHCKRGFNSSATLEAHMQTHDENKPVEPQIDSLFESQTTDDSVLSTQCSICNLQCSCAEELLRHLDCEHNQAVNAGYESRSRPPSSSRVLLTCPFCQKNDFSSEESFQLHLEAMHDTTPLIVSQSSAPVINKDRITCGLCPETFPDISLLQKHTLKKHSLKDLIHNFDPTYSCDECGRIFDSILSLHSHTNSAHTSSASEVIRKSLHSQNQPSNSSQIYQCSQCDTGLQNLKAFTAHMRQHLDIKQHEQHCDFCGLAFHSESTRDAHLVTHYLHKESQYSCKTCNKTFDVPEELQKHLMDIHAIHLYRCSLCKDIFESRVDVQVHFAVAHSNEVVRYRCRSCNAAFPSEDQFNVHLQVVHLQRPLASLQMYFCSICNKSFANESEHNTIHAAAFCCPICGESFTVEYLYDKHIETVHRNQMDYFGISEFSPKANLCTPSSISSVRVGHSSNFTATTPTVIKCNICDETYDTTVELARHKLQHCKVIHSEICNVCQEPLGSVEQFYSHTRQHTIHGIPTSCVVCKQSLVSLVEMQAHAKFHLKLAAVPRKLCDQCGSYCDSKCATVERSPSIGENLKCSHCHVKFEDDDELKKHIHENHNAASQRSYQCIKCQKSFVTEAEIRAHVASHVLQDGINHHCSLCKKVFDSPSKLQRHLIEHSFIGCLEYECYLCNMVFLSVEPLQQHMLTKHSLDDRPYECRLCEHKFFFRAELENHTFTHHNDESTPSPLITAADSSRPAAEMFVCHHCGLVFNSANTLNSHCAQCRRKTVVCNEEFHSNPNISSSSQSSSIKPAEGCDKKISSSNLGNHPCPHCPKIFHSISALQGHSHVHMNSKVHQCIKCKKVFLTAAKLRNHQRQHNGDKPFPCEFCRRFFSRKDNLKVHMKIHFKNGSTSPSAVSLNMEPPTMVTSPTFGHKKSLELGDYNFDVSSNGSNNSTPNNLKDSLNSLSGFSYNLRSHCSMVNDEDSSDD